MKLFQWVKEIRSNAGTLHFKRYAIIECKWFALYIHRIYEHDHDFHLHSHPWNFMGVVLKGSYVERYQQTDLFCDKHEVTQIKSPGSYSSGDRQYFHKIDEILDGPVTTLFFTYGTHQPWYYYVEYNNAYGGYEILESSLYRKKKHENKI